MARVWGVRHDRPDEASFERFVTASGPSLLRTALALTGDSGHAEDVLQEALERVAARWSRLTGNPEAYARRAVVNAANDRHRTRRARPAETGSPVSPETGVGDRTALVDLRDALIQGLQLLPRRQRSVLVCRYVLDLSERETAGMLGIGVGTVKASTNRGLAALRMLAPQLALATERKECPS